MPPKDIPIDEAQRIMASLLKRNPLVLLWVKWTCPGCGERCVANTAFHEDPNQTTFVHTERLDGSQCGTSYAGGMVGLQMVIPANPTVRAEMLAIHKGEQP